jgi:acetyl-CoA synthetase
MSPSPSTAAYREARDTLVSLTGAHDEAVRRFRWPDVGETFNWAIDWFDAIARGNDRVALRIVEEDGSERSLTFDQMATRSDQVAVWLSDLGVRQGDRILLMLGNQVQLWETMLAVFKLGAVIMPTTAALGPEDLRDRVDRGGASVVVANPADAAKFDDVPGDYLRISVGPVEGWQNYEDADAAQPREFATATAASDPLLLYFTSGTTSKPKLVEHTQVSYPVGHLSTMYWIGARPGDVHLAISSPGWAKHAWSCFFAPWIAEATIFVYNYARFNAADLLEQIRRAGVTTFCAPPTVWRMLIQADLGAGPGELRELLAAGEPLNPEVITQVEKAWA